MAYFHHYDNLISFLEFVFTSSSEATSSWLLLALPRLPRLLRLRRLRRHFPFAFPISVDDLNQSALIRFREKVKKGGGKEKEEIDSRRNGRINYPRIA